MTSIVGHALEEELVEPNLVPEFHHPGLPRHIPEIPHFARSGPKFRQKKKLNIIGKRKKGGI